MSTAPKRSSSNQVNFYDDNNHDYREFWVGREYEHESEILAINSLLKGKHYGLAMDYGGGYGRVTPKLLEYANKVILVDPSDKQLQFAKEFLKGKSVELRKQESKDSVPAEDNSLDLLVMIRVSHHLPNPSPVFQEIARVLKPGGEALIEIANEAHFVNRVRYLKRMKRVPAQPVAVGVHANGQEDDTPFVNHNPRTIVKLLNEVGLSREDKLSVSNLRQQFLKEHLSLRSLMFVERQLQSSLSSLDFGPSVFFLVKKT